MRRRQPLPPARPGDFWRRAFWTRPALLVGYGVVFLWLAASFALGGFESAARAQALEDPCFEAGDDRCVTPVTGDLAGPFESRRVSCVTWRLDVGGREYASWVVSRKDSERVRELAPGPVTALALDGEVLALQDGTEVVGRAVWADFGHAAAGWLMAFAALCIAVAALRFAPRKARAAGGWWSVTTVPLDQPTFSALVLGGVSLLTCSLVKMELPWLAALGVGVGLATLLMAVYAAELRRSGNYQGRRRSDEPVSRRRHERPSRPDPHP